MTLYFLISGLAQASENMAPSAGAQYANAIAAFILVVALVLGLAWVARISRDKFGLGGVRAAGPEGALKVESTLHLDVKTRVVLISRGTKAHLLCVQAGQPVQVIESSIAWQPLQPPVTNPPHTGESTDGA